MITSGDVERVRFQATKFREGYDQDEVDDFLDRVVATLRAAEQGTPLDAPLTADQVLSTRFTATKMREGYDQGDVDEFLDRVVATLREREGGPVAPSTVTDVPPPPQPWQGPADAQPVPGLIPPPTSWWRRLLGG